MRVNGDPIHDGADHFYGWMQVDHATGNIYVVFYDRRTDKNNVLARVILARSTDGGSNFANYAWTTRSFDPSWQFIGDYNALAVYAGRAYGAWTTAKSVSAKKLRTMTLRQMFASRTYVQLGEARF